MGRPLLIAELASFYFKLRVKISALKRGAGWGVVDEMGASLQRAHLNLNPGHHIPVCSSQLCFFLMKKRLFL